MRSPLLVTLVCLSMFTLAACKVKIVVPKGGAVRTQSEAYSCEAMETCIIEVTDLFFDETFVAVPKTGYIFQGWRTGDEKLCGGKRESCALYTFSFSRIPVLLSILRSDRAFNLEPNFVLGSESNIGNWKGQWTDITFSTVGDISLTGKNKMNNMVEVTLDIDGMVGGFFDPEPQSVLATQKQNGTIEFNGTVDAMGDPATLIFSLTPAGVLTISMPDLPLIGFDSFSAQGTMSGGSAFLNYEVTFTPMGSAEGTVSFSKE